MERVLRVHVSEVGADPERVAVLTRYLRAELLLLDVEDVTLIGIGEPPAGARGSGIAVVDGLLVAIGQAAGSLLQVVLAIREWLRRGDSGGRVVRIELDGNKIELSQANKEQQATLIELFVSRFSKGDGG
jgi:Effector Associated Constant Component 1